MITSQPVITSSSVKTMDQPDDGSTESRDFKLSVGLLNGYLILFLFATIICLLQGRVAASPIYHNIPVCHGFNCNIISTISLSDGEWASVTGWFKSDSSNPDTERSQIRHAIGWMEVLVGRHGPGRKDRALDLKHATSRIGQMDCIDESINTTTYLKLFEKQGLLRWHRVVQRVQRRAIFDAHWASQIEEVVTGDHYVIDSWFQDNGMLPNVQRTKDWIDIPFYTALRDNSNN